MSALTASVSVLGMISGPIAAAADAKLSGARVVATDTSMPLRANALARAWPILPKPMIAKLIETSPFFGSDRVRSTPLLSLTFRALRVRVQLGSQEARVGRLMLQVVVTAVVIFQRLGELVGVLLDTVQRGDRHSVELTFVSLREGAHTTGLAEAIVKVGLGFARRNPRVIRQLVFAFFDLKIFRWHNREPKARLGANRAIAARRSFIEINLGLKGDRTAVTRAVVGFLRHRVSLVRCG